MRTTAQPRRRPPTITTPAPAAHETELVDEMGEFLDEVDALLEDQDWMLCFRQKGGQ